MGKHHRRSNFARNAAAFGATVAGITALTAPTAAAAPVAIPGVGSLDVPGAQDVTGLIDAIPGVGEIAGRSIAAAPAVSTGQKIVDAARSQIGTPYVWGGDRPGGFDCSGLTSWAYQQVGKSIPRTAAAQQRATRRVSSPQPGDLVFFGSPAFHVGIYAGGGMMYDSPRTGRTTGLHKIWSKNVSYGRA